ncbi:uncharacterized protein LOC108040756 [Drosophila rhopaloa]|uniref:Uncharacterized protein LOC108040756 n=1 Tax=Drosophila rhopaloa TaxID=1041015 RepID=A0A6P4E785_DRORH|nr:uncharacterized protein LOC108040756 [Drosophila rhopaloa]
MDNIYHQDNARATVNSVIDDPMTQFIHSIYHMSLIMIGLTVVSWVLLLLTNTRPHQHLPFPGYVPVIVIFLAMVTMHCIPGIAYCSPCKWMMAGLVMVCTIVAGCFITFELGLLTTVLVMLCVAVILLVLNFSGAKCPQEILPGGLWSTMLMLVLLLVLVVVGIAQLCTGNEELLETFVAVLFIMLVIAIPIQAQFNHGRLDVVEVVPREHLMICTLTVYLHTVMFFCCISYFIEVSEKKAATASTDVHGHEVESVTERNYN